MLSCLVQAREGGEEIFECSKVRMTYIYPDNDGTKKLGRMPAIACDLPQGPSEYFDDHVIFVMNSAGQTIAKYDYRRAPEQLAA